MATALVARVRATLDLVKFAHTVFALPFALLAALTAAGGAPPLRTLLLIVLAMVAARTGAMAANRLADRRFDARNPRTASRHLPAGKLRPGYVLGLTIASFAAFVAAAWVLNRLAFQLSPLAVAILVGYSFTKRFTWASHLFLGLALSGAPVGAWIAVTGEIALAPLVLAAAVLMWVAGFDVLYACQDVEFDRLSGLHSIPACFGVAGALRISAGLHAAAAVLFFAFAAFAPVGAFYLAGAALAAALLYHEHRLVTPRSLARLDEAFFAVNGLISVALLVAGALDLLVFAP